MTHSTAFRLKLVSVVVAGLFATPHAFAEEQAAKTQKIEVISTTPLQGIGLPLEKIPASIQVVDGEEMHNQQSLTIADFMSQNLVGVNVNETQNNPFQPNVNFRGFTASPLLGTPQGLSIFYDGVRINEPFGDVVSWDLIPMNAVSGMTLVPGSNPVFGLNTLGGAISLQTKSGRTHQGGAVEAYAGSWARKGASAEYGGVADNNVDYFFAVNAFDENGWRDSSPSELYQFFGKVGWQNETTDINLSLTAADTDLIGNGFVQREFIDDFGYDSINTKPDQTENKMVFLNLNGSHWLSEKTMFSGNTYYRHARTRTLNGDVNDDVDDSDFMPDCSAAAGGTDFEEECGGALNRSKSNRNGYGFTAQLTFDHDLFGRKNQLITGLGYDYGRTTFSQGTEFGNLTADRGVVGVGEFSDENEVKLRGISKTWSLYATDTFSINDITHLTLSGRYNYTRVKNRDGLIDPPDQESLTENHSFNRFNPAIGLTLTPTPDLTVFGSYNEGSRAPTAIELGCAFQDLDGNGEADTPCKLPNAMAGDPPLKKVVSRTYELGARGKFANDWGWTANLYRTQNTDDIQFIADSIGQGNFQNVGKTRRVGMDMGLNGTISNFRWFAGYSYVRATYESAFFAVSEVNSSADGDDRILVTPGDRIPGIPNHQFKFRGEWQATPNWSIGSNIVAFSDQYSHGNENNKHQGAGAKTGGYTIVNLDSRYRFGDSGWQVFGKINNIFDKEYYTGGLLGENFFDENGVFLADDEASALVSPGAPRAGWIGVRYEFGGRKSTPSYDFD
ncbi:putative TonB-dependent receptor BfrD [Methylophilaceae bacterium]|nr:putative TonB-dependent receptor BfrD [Methylophilaceae bacterium]